MIKYHGSNAEILAPIVCIALLFGFSGGGGVRELVFPLDEDSLDESSKSGSGEGALARGIQELGLTEPL